MDRTDFETNQHQQKQAEKDQCTYPDNLSYSTASLDDIELETSPVPKSKTSSESEQERRLAFRDRYNVREILCQGGQANVHKAYDKVACKEVAIKVYSKAKL